MVRAIRNRDQHCQFYGCTQTHNLQIHPIKDWAEGGTTCVSNAVCVCQYHHTLLHEGGYSIQAVEHSEKHLNEQFSMHPHSDDAIMFSFEKELRSDIKSFNRVRKLSPTQYRFRIVDADAQNIYSTNATIAYKPMLNSLKQSKPLYLSTSSPSDSTRVGCAEAVSGFYHVVKKHDSHKGGTSGVCRSVRSGSSRRVKTLNNLAKIMSPQRRRLAIALV